MGTREDFEEAWSASMMLEATKLADGSWTFLPYSGGLMDQPELLMRNIFRITTIIRKIREASHAA